MLLTSSKTEPCLMKAWLAKHTDDVPLKYWFVKWNPVKRAFSVYFLKWTWHIAMKNIGLHVLKRIHEVKCIQVVCDISAKQLPNVSLFSGEIGTLNYSIFVTWTVSSLVCHSKHKPSGSGLQQSILRSV